MAGRSRGGALPAAQRLPACNNHLQRPSGPYSPLPVACAGFGHCLVGRVRAGDMRRGQDCAPGIGTDEDTSGSSLHSACAAAGNRFRHSRSVRPPESGHAQRFLDPNREHLLCPIGQAILSAEAGMVHDGTVRRPLNANKPQVSGAHARNARARRVFSMQIDSF